MVKWNDGRPPLLPKIEKVALIPRVYEKIEDIRSDVWGRLTKDQRNFIKENFYDQNFVNQILINGTINRVNLVKQSDGTFTVLNAHGYINKQTLGVGKDGHTFLGVRYLDTKNTFVVKTISNYAQDYMLHTGMLGNIVKSNNCSPVLIPFNIADNLSHLFYPLEEPYTHVTKTNKQWLDALADICDMNSWLISSYGVLLWDFGFNNGKNYMIDRDNKVKWVDYGGAGLLKIRNIYDKSIVPAGNNWNSTAGLLKRTLVNKKSLVFANTRFIRIALFLHIQYWLDQHVAYANDVKDIDNTIPIWMSMIQLNHKITQEIDDWVVKKLITTDWLRNIYADLQNDKFTENLAWDTMSTRLREVVLDDT